MYLLCLVPPVCRRGAGAACRLHHMRWRRSSLCIVRAAGVVPGIKSRLRWAMVQLGLLLWLVLLLMLMMMLRLVPVRGWGSRRIPAVLPIYCRRSLSTLSCAHVRHVSVLLRRMHRQLLLAEAREGRLLGTAATLIIHIRVLGRAAVLCVLGYRGRGCGLVHLACIAWHCLLGWRRPWVGGMLYPLRCGKLGIGSRLCASASLGAVVCRMVHDRLPLRKHGLRLRVAGRAHGRR